MTVFDQLTAGGATAEEALDLFDSLPAVDPAFMLGSWKGRDFATGHPLDGLLEAYRWHGKRFDSEEDVQPLLFSKIRGGVAAVDPRLFRPALGLIGRVPMPRSALLGRLFQLLLPLLETRRSRARLRATTYRGKASATMIYDHLPIHDVFRRVDDDTVFAVMDMKGLASPFFFVLRRERIGGRDPIEGADGARWIGRRRGPGRS